MTRKKKHINKFLAPTQSRDNPANLFMFMCFSFPSGAVADSGYRFKTPSSHKTFQKFPCAHHHAHDMKLPLSPITGLAKALFSSAISSRNGLPPNERMPSSTSLIDAATPESRTPNGAPAILKKEGALTSDTAHIDRNKSKQGKKSKTSEIDHLIDR